MRVCRTSRIEFEKIATSSLTVMRFRAPIQIVVLLAIVLPPIAAIAIFFSGLSDFSVYLKLLFGSGLFIGAPLAGWFFSDEIALQNDGITWYSYGTLVTLSWTDFEVGVPEISWARESTTRPSGFSCNRPGWIRLKLRELHTDRMVGYVRLRLRRGLVIAGEHDEITKAQEFLAQKLGDTIARVGLE